MTKWLDGLSSGTDKVDKGTPGRTIYHVTFGSHFRPTYVRSRSCIATEKFINKKRKIVLSNTFRDNFLIYSVDGISRDIKSSPFYYVFVILLPCNDNGPLP